MARIAAAAEGMQVDALVLQQPPETLDKDVVNGASAPVHRDAHAEFLQALRPGPGGELAALIGVEDLSWLVAFQRLLQVVVLELHLHGIGESPRQHLAARPVHDGNEVEEALRQRDTSNVGAPDLVRPVDRHPAQQIGVEPVTFGRDRRPWPAMDQSQTHYAHLPAHPLHVHKLSRGRRCQAICRALENGVSRNWRSISAVSAGFRALPPLCTWKKVERVIDASRHCLIIDSFS